MINRFALGHVECTLINCKQNITSLSLLVGIVRQLFCNHLADEGRAGLFTFIVFLPLRGCLCSVSLPRGVVGWSVVVIVAFH